MTNPISSILRRLTARAAPPNAFQEAIANKDGPTAVAILQRLVARGDSHAMVTLGNLYSMGDCLPRDDVEAALWFRQAANAGSVDGQALLGYVLAGGTGVEQNLDESAHWLWKAARAGHSEALDWLSDLTMQYPAVVGKSFTMPELIALRKARGAEQLRSAISPSS